VIIHQNPVIAGASTQAHPFAQSNPAQAHYVDPTPYNGPMHMQPLPPAAQTGRPNVNNTYNASYGYYHN
jgi:hypothetical protein